MRLASTLLLVVSAGSMGVGALGCDGPVAIGDYRAYRLASSDATLSEDCFIDDPTNEHTSNFRTGGTILIYNAPEGDGEDGFLLDIGGIVLPGELKDDGSYEFKGKETDVNDVGGNVIRDADKDGIEDFMDPFVDSDADGLDDDSIVDDPMVDIDNDGLDDRFEDNIVDANSDGLDDRDTYLPSDTKVTEADTYTVEMLQEGGKVTGTFVQLTDRSCAGSLCAQFPPFTCKATSEFVGVEIDPESVSVPIEGGNQ